MKESIERKVMKNHGITIVSLVMTVIILLILAGVTIGLVFNGDGLFNKADVATGKYNQKQAEEILTLTLQEAQMIKYSEELTEQKLDEMINKIGKVDEASNNLVTVNKYIFLIDRSVPKIIKCLELPSESGTGSGSSSGENQGGSNSENDKTLNNKITINIPAEDNVIKFGASEISNDLNVNQYSYSITPTDGIPNGKEIGTFNKNETVKINVTKSATYTITVTAIDDKGNRLATANGRITTLVLPQKGETVPEEGWTIAEAKGLVKRDGLKAHLGEKVQYSPTAGGTWRIFYYDTEDDGNGDGYFGKMGTMYLKRDFALEDITLSDYKSHIPSDGGTIMRKMNPKWAASSNGSSIDLGNEHCVAWLCDPAEWEANYKVVGVADYAIGSPSVEMYMKAYNVYKDNNPNSTTLINKIGNENGYYLGAYNSYTWNGSNEYYTGNNSIEEGPNKIFRTAGENFLWVASPSANANNRLTLVHGSYAHMGGSSYETVGNGAGVCPIVSISQ